MVNSCVTENVNYKNIRSDHHTSCSYISGYVNMQKGKKRSMFLSKTSRSDCLRSVSLKTSLIHTNVFWRYFEMLLFSRPKKRWDCKWFKNKVFQIIQIVEYF